MPADAVEQVDEVSRVGQPHFFWRSLFGLADVSSLRESRRTDGLLHPYIQWPSTGRVAFRPASET
jgi:hypothetical protein